MKIDIGKYQIRTDKLQYILQSKDFKEQTIKDTKTGKETKREDHVVYGYFTTLQGCLKEIPNQVLLKNDDIQNVLKELKEIKEEIKTLMSKEVIV